MLMRSSFQNGGLKRCKRKRGPDVWEFRWREQNTTGRTVRRNLIVGNVEDLPTKSKAKIALSELDLNINRQRTSLAHPALMTVGELAAHYDKHELGEDRPSKTQGTVEVYREFLEYWIVPRWKDVRLSAVKPVEVEQWLRALKLANGTKSQNS